MKKQAGRCPDPPGEKRCEGSRTPRAPHSLFAGHHPATVTPPHAILMRCARRPETAGLGRKGKDGLRRYRAGTGHCGAYDVSSDHVLGEQGESMEPTSAVVTSPWNSLEVVKFFADVAVPVAIAFFGWRLQKAINTFEAMQWKSQKLIEKRLQIYDEVAPLINDLFCYFAYIGSWKELDPPDVIKIKRVIDKNIHLARPIFSNELFNACRDFLLVCFDMYNGWGEEARLRTKYDGRRDAKGNAWREEWKACFSENIPEKQVLQDSYERVMVAFSRDIGVREMPFGRV
jgi:hypothetical protein